MKKIIALFVCLFAFTLQSFASTWVPADRVSTVGSKLLTKSGITAKITFKVVDGIADNSDVVTTKTVQVSSTNLSYAGNDNEVAAVVANELGHIICNHTDKAKIRKLALARLGVDTTTTTATLASTQLSAKEETEADLVGIDLMINAGYNPLAMVVVITKYPGSTMDALVGRPCNADRAMESFNYLTYSYPAKVKAGYACNEYRNFLTYANPIVEKRNASSKSLSKFKKDQAKKQKIRKSNIAKYKMSGGLSSWGVLYDSLNTKK